MMIDIKRWSCYTVTWKKQLIHSPLKIDKMSLNENTLKYQQRVPLLKALPQKVVRGLSK